MKYLKTFEDFSPVSREEKIDILAKTTSYSMEDLQQMSDDELDTLYSGNDAEDTVVPETAEEHTPVAAEGATSGASDEDDNYDMYRSDGPMTREELRQMHQTIQEKKKNKGFIAMMDAKKRKEKGEEGKKDAKKDDKKDDKKPVAKKK